MDSVRVRVFNPSRSSSLLHHICFGSNPSSNQAHRSGRHEPSCLGLFISILLPLLRFSHLPPRIHQFYQRKPPCYERQLPFLTLSTIDFRDDRVHNTRVSITDRAPRCSNACPSSEHSHCCRRPLSLSIHQHQQTTRSGHRQTPQPSPPQLQLPSHRHLPHVAGTQCVLFPCSRSIPIQLPPQGVYKRAMTALISQPVSLPWPIATFIIHSFPFLRALPCRPPPFPFSCR